MKNFKELIIWQKGIEITMSVYEITKDFPKEETYNLISQIRRSAVSVPSNIAEGNSRNSEKDKHRFMEIALGSTFELETQLILASKLNYGKSEQFESLLSSIDEEQKMLMSYMKKIKPE